MPQKRISFTPRAAARSGRRDLPSGQPELRPQIRWHGNRVPSAEELDKMHHSAHENCFIANSVNRRHSGETVTAVYHREAKGDAFAI
jgi:organic hydroperoxide reductase OsmC/OhrA